MRYGFLFSVALVALVTTGPVSFAFQLQTVQTNPDGTAKFTSPGNLTDSMADSLSGKSDGTTMHFGSTTLRFSGGNGSSAYGSSASGMSPALQERLMIRPYAVGNSAQLH
jgi:hypothetical protein